MRTLKRHLASTEAAEIAEAAVVLPLAFMFLLGIIWFGRAYNIYSTIQQAAQQGAIAAAREPCATCTGGNGPYSTTAADNAIYNVMQAANLDVTKIQLPPSTPTCGTLPCAACASPPWPTGGGPGGTCATVSPKAGGSVYVCQNVQLNPATSPAQCGTVVSFQYPFQFYLPFTSVNMSTYYLSANAESRMEN